MDVCKYEGVCVCVAPMSAAWGVTDRTPLLVNESCVCVCACLQLKEADPDLRLMAVFDLSKELSKREFQTLDNRVAQTLSDALIRTLDDPSADIQGMAVQW